MKALKKISLILVAVVVAFNANSQEYASNYRITAYKKGDNQILSQSNIAEVVLPISLYVPNSFTPNNDGLNDTFGAEGEGIQEYKIQIFNRWGELVFTGNKTTERWNGSYNSIPGEEGVYTYLIHAKGAEKRIKKAGTVTLIVNK